MKKIILFALFITSVLLFQNCKKGSTDTSTTTTTSPVLQAYINGTLWEPDTLKATITYTASTKAKVFNFTGTKSQKQVTFSLILPNSTNTSDFTAATYSVDGTNNLSMAYNVQQKNSSGAYVFVPFGTVGTGAGTVTVSSVDATNKTITGYFSLTTKVANYDSNGNVISVTVVTVTSGAFTNMPFTFTSN